MYVCVDLESRCLTGCLEAGAELETFDEFNSELLSAFQTHKPKNLNMGRLRLLFHVH